MIGVDNVMGLYIRLEVRNNNVVYDYDEFNGISSFGNIRDFMLYEYNYQYGEYLKLNKTIIKSMIKEMINDCFELSDYDVISNRLSFVRSLLEAYDYIRNGYEVYFECDW